MGLADSAMTATASSRRRVCRAVTIIASALGAVFCGLSGAGMLMIAVVLLAGGMAHPAWPAWLWPLAASCTLISAVMLLCGTIQTVRGNARAPLLVTAAGLWTAASTLVVPTIVSWWPALLVPPVLTLVGLVASAPQMQDCSMFAYLREERVRRGESTTFTLPTWTAMVRWMAALGVIGWLGTSATSELGAIIAIIALLGVVTAIVARADWQRANGDLLDPRPSMKARP